MRSSLNPAGGSSRKFRWGATTILSLCLVYGFSSAVWATPQDKEAPNSESESAAAKSLTPVTKRTGPLQEIKADLQALTDLVSVENQLQLNMKASYEEADPIVSRIRETGGWGGNTSRSGADQFAFHMNGNKLAGVIKRSPSEGGLENTVLLEEKAQPFRKLEISGTTKGALSINIKCNESNYLLRLRQLTDGKILVQEIDHDQIFAGTAPDFAKFCLQHRQFCSEKLAPVLNHFGLGPIPTPYSSTIQERFIAIITPWSDSELSRMQKFTSALDADNYQEREAASLSIREELKEIELMLRYVNDPQFPPEARSRIRKMIYENAEPEKKNEIVFFEELLANVDEGYLIDLINLQTDSEKVSVLIRKLRQTSPEFRDPQQSEEQILKLIAQRPSESDSNNANSNFQWRDSPDPMDQQGHFQAVKNSVGALIKLTPHEDSARVDRAHWKKPFDGREIKELSDEVKKLLEDNNLPAAWYNAGGPKHEAESASHPQVLFEKLEALGDGQQELTVRSNYYRTYAGTLNPNREFEKQAMNGRLIFDKTISDNMRRRRDVKKIDVTTSSMMIELVEKAEPRRTLLVEETTPGNLELLIIHEDGDGVLKLDLRKGKATLIDIRGASIRTFTSGSFQEILSSEPAYFQNEFFPLVEHLGVELSGEFEPSPN